MPGGGGWGDAFERDPGAVLADVRAEKISLGRARQTYGVVVASGGTTVDEAETQRERADRWDDRG